MSITDPVLLASITSVTNASIVCRAVQAGLDRVRAIAKDDRSPVTVADFASQAVVAHTLREMLGDFTLVGEEAPDMLRDPANSAVLDLCVEAVRLVWKDATATSIIDAIDRGTGEPGAGPFWTLDPVDGTKGFLRGGQYAIALALIDKGTPVLGAMGCPNLPLDPSVSPDSIDRDGSLFVAVRSEGAFAGLATDFAKTRRTVSKRTTTGSAPLRLCGSVEAAHGNAEAADAIAAGVEPRMTVVRFDSQCKYGAVANGQADVYLRLPVKRTYVERIWDHAAGAIIAAEAGCVVTDAAGKPLDFGRGRGLEGNTGIVCATPEFHAKLVAAIGASGMLRRA